MKTMPPAVLLIALLAGACAGPPAEEPPAPVEIEGEPADAAVEIAEEPVERVLDARAAEIAKAMSDTLKKAATFSLHVESWSDEETADGGMVSLASESRILVRRPDGLFLERNSERGRRNCWYDGKSFTVLDIARNLYARIDAPATLEATVDLLAEKYGVVTPLADLLAEDPAESYGKVADRVDYLGTQPVRGTPCHHLSYRAPWLRWQLWVAAEGDPLPRRVEITYADEHAQPRFLAYLDEWKLGVAAEASAFTFQAPEGARAIDFAPLPAPETGEGK